MKVIYQTLNDVKKLIGNNFHHFFSFPQRKERHATSTTKGGVPCSSHSDTVVEE